MLIYPVLAIWRPMARGAYGDVHRAVVQTFMSRKFMPEKDAIELVRSFARWAHACAAAFPGCFLSHPATEQPGGTRGCARADARELLLTAGATSPFLTSSTPPNHPPPCAKLALERYRE